MSDSLAMPNAHFQATPITRSDSKTSNSDDVVLNMKTLTSGIFSDLTITCQGREFKLHKLVLYTQSTYFRKLLGGQFKERDASTIEFPDDNPEVLEGLFHYFYHFVLDVSKRPPGTSPSSFTVQVYALADKYDVPRLCDLATKHFHKTCNPTTDLGDFLDAIRAVDAYTVGERLWARIKPKIRGNIKFLLKQEELKTLVREPDFEPLFFELLGMIGSGDGEEDEGDGDGASPVATTAGLRGNGFSDLGGEIGGFGCRGPGRRLG